MVDNKLVVFIRRTFSEITINDNIGFYPNNTFSKYEIITKFGYSIIFKYQYMDNCYNICIRYSEFDILLSSFVYYKEYVKRNLKENLFNRSKINDHLTVLHTFISEHELIKSPYLFESFLLKSKKSYEHIFIH